MGALLLIASFCLTLLLVRWLKSTPSRSLPLPPGPKRYPVIGSLLHVPVDLPWKTFHEWSKIYGDVVYVKIPHKKIVVLDSIEAVLDLFEKRSEIYSDRPQTVMNELMLVDRWCFPLIGYSSLWRSYRREFHQFFNQHQVHKYQPTQLRGCQVFLQRVLDSPSQLNQHILLLMRSMILKIVYDMNVTDLEDEFLRLANEGVEKITEAALPGRFWVEFAPILRHLPSWVPGASFKRYVEDLNPKMDELLDRPFYTVKRDYAAGTAGDSMAATLIHKLQSNEDVDKSQREYHTRNILGVAYAAGSDTSTAALQSFFIAMSLYPDIQTKAQKELDRIVGPGKLPTFEDYDRLVYIQAIILETLRWLPVSPLGLPHRVTRDDEYRGMLIPEGTTVIPNIWAILHNPEDYPEPYRFNPDRFIKNGSLNTSVRNPMNIALGFGRRICPGRWFIHSSLFITIASTLHTMDIFPDLGSDGNEFDPFTSENVYSGIKLTLGALPCTVTIRSDREPLIRDIAIS
ncbi:hypothetical protein QCA50_015107 [Cerrena zonata]|uniref:Cytochrome P450 n=1 Tax=Cerrena zonata TaxID=2478898 RepID=A0AAW0FYB4_9APHY